MPLVLNLSARVAEDANRARVNDARDREITRGFEHVACALHVDLLGHARVVPGSYFVPGGDVKDAVDAFHGRAKRFALSDVAHVQLHAERSKEGGLVRGSDERSHVVTAPNQLFNELAAEKPGGSRDEIPRHAT